MWFETSRGLGCGFRFFSNSSPVHHTFLDDFATRSTVWATTSQPGRQTTLSWATLDLADETRWKALSMADGALWLRHASMAVVFGLWGRSRKHSAWAGHRQNCGCWVTRTLLIERRYKRPKRGRAAGAAAFGRFLPFLSSRNNSAGPRHRQNWCFQV